MLYLPKELQERIFSEIPLGTTRLINHQLKSIKHKEFCDHVQLTYDFVTYIYPQLSNPTLMQYDYQCCKKYIKDKTITYTYHYDSIWHEGKETYDEAFILFDIKMLSQSAKYDFDYTSIYEIYYILSNNTTYSKNKTLSYLQDKYVIKEKDKKNYYHFVIMYLWFCTSVLNTCVMDEEMILYHIDMMVEEITKSYNILNRK